MTYQLVCLQSLPDRDAPLIPAIRKPYEKRKVKTARDSEHKGNWYHNLDLCDGDIGNSDRYMYSRLNKSKLATFKTRLNELLV